MRPIRINALWLLVVLGGAGTTFSVAQACAESHALGAASANNLTLERAAGTDFVIEEGVRLTGQGWTARGPDVEVFESPDNPIYRMYFTTPDKVQLEPGVSGNWTSHSAVSADGLTFTYEGQRLFSATNRTDRDLLRRPDGSWRMYTLIGGGDPWYCIDSFLSPDGLQFTHEPGKRIPFGDDWDKTAARSPEAAILDDGRVRLYYIGWSGPSGPYAKQIEPEHQWRILSAVSVDGASFSKEPGIRFEGGVAMSKPQVVRLTDGGWRMYFARELADRTALVSAVSDDGLAWDLEGGLRFDPGKGGAVGTPSLVRDQAGTLRLYFDLSILGESTAIRSAAAR